MDKQLTDIGAERLVKAIVMQAADDYKKAYITDRESSKTKRLEQWFQGKWCHNLTGGADADKIIAALRMQAEYEEWRRIKKCNRCNSKKWKICIHRSGQHYTTVERGELICPKEKS